MGEAKRRKKLDPNYGKPQPPTVDVINYSEGLLDQKCGIIAWDLWSDSGGIAFTKISFEELNESEIFETAKSVLNGVARHPENLKIGFNRQRVLGMGYQNIMPVRFKQQVLNLHGDNPNAHVVFDWYNREEIRTIVSNNRRAGKGRAVFFEIIDYLTYLNQSANLFPCQISGLKSGDTYFDLLWVVDANDPEQAPRQIIRI